MVVTDPWGISDPWGITYLLCVPSRWREGCGVLCSVQFVFVARAVWSKLCFCSAAAWGDCQRGVTCEGRFSESQSVWHQSPGGLAVVCSLRALWNRKSWNRWDSKICFMEVVAVVGEVTPACCPPPLSSRNYLLSSLPRTCTVTQWINTRDLLWVNSAPGNQTLFVVRWHLFSWKGTKVKKTRKAG